MAVVGGFLAEGCTVVVPSFSWSYAIPQPQDMRPLRNGSDYEHMSAADPAGADRVYTPHSEEIDADMGAVARAVLTMPSRARGNHPICSFSAVGPEAADLVSGQRPLDVFAPLARLAERGGAVVLMGVGIEEMTLLHLAEKSSGRNLFRRWALDCDGLPMQVEAGGCSGGFVKLAPALSSVMQETRVGLSQWMVFAASETLRIAADMIRRSPEITHCGDPCGRCRDAVLGGPILW